MIELTERNRARWLWMLAAVTAAYGLANVLVFFTTGSFGPVWFATGILVYSVLLVSALVLSATDTEEDVAEPVEEQAPRVQILEQETIYATTTGRALLARVRQNGTERTLLFSVVGDEVLPAGAIEDRLRRVSGEVPDLDDVGDVEEALARRARRSYTETPPPGSISVELVDREVLHRSDEGRVLRARYRFDEQEHVRLFAITADAVTPVDELEGDLDEIRVDEVPVDATDVFDEMLEQARREDPPTLQVSSP